MGFPDFGLSKKLSVGFLLLQGEVVGVFGEDEVLRF